MKKYILNKKVLTFVATVVLLNNSVVVGGNAHPLDLTDSGGSDWFNIEVSMQDGGAKFKWSSEDSSTTVEISGDSIATLIGEDDGVAKVAVNTADRVLEFNVQAERTIEQTQEPGAAPSVPLTVQYITSLRVDNPNSNMFVFHETPASASSAAAKTYLRYQTFIPRDYVDAYWPECAPDAFKKYLFAGDDRNFDPASNDFKTRFQVTVDWLNQGAVTYSRAVGETRRYEADSNGKAILSTVKRATASVDGMVLTTLSKSGTLVHYKLNHSVTNPMCAGVLADSILYETDVWIARSGAYTIKNEFRRVPNHELYLKDSDESNWTAVMQESLVDMNCLLKGLSSSFICNTTRSFHETSR
ncbi:MAG: hypothetical protein RLZZ606_83 [Actinomycetota bacterium]